MKPTVQSLGAQVLPNNFRVLVRMLYIRTYLNEGVTLPPDTSLRSLMSSTTVEDFSGSTVLAKIRLVEKGTRNIFGRELLT